MLMNPTKKFGLCVIQAWYALLTTDEQSEFFTDVYWLLLTSFDAVIGGLVYLFGCLLLMFQVICLVEAFMQLLTCKILFRGESLHCSLEESAC